MEHVGRRLPGPIVPASTRRFYIIMCTNTVGLIGERKITIVRMSPLYYSQEQTRCSIQVYPRSRFILVCPRALPDCVVGTRQISAVQSFHEARVSAAQVLMIMYAHINSMFHSSIDVLLFLLVVVDVRQKNALITWCMVDENPGRFLLRQVSTPDFQGVS